MLGVTLCHQLRPTIVAPSPHLCPALRAAHVLAPTGSISAGLHARLWAAPNFGIRRCVDPHAQYTSLGVRGPSPNTVTSRRGQDSQRGSGVSKQHSVRYLGTAPGRAASPHVSAPARIRVGKEGGIAGVCTSSPGSSKSSPTSIATQVATIIIITTSIMISAQ